MLKIFAKRGTTEKALISVPREFVVEAIKALNKKHGGNWVLVDKIKPGELLLFDDGLQYLGFHGKDERYCSGINKID